MKKQRILFVVEKLDLIGGAETLLYSLLASLKKNDSNYEPEVLVVAGHTAFEEKINSLGIPVHVLDQDVFLEGKDKFDLQHVLDSPHTALKSLKQSKTLDALEGIDVIVGLMTAANVCASSIAGALAQHTGTKVPVIWTQHDTNPELYVSPELLALSKKLSIDASCVVCQPSSQKTYEGIYPEDVPFISLPNAADAEVFSIDSESRGHLREKLRIPKDAPVVYLSARYAPMKDVKGFILAAEALAKEKPDTHFILCGSGMDDSNLEIESFLPSSLKNKFHLLGTVPHHKMREVHNAGDIFFLSSCDTETQSVAAIEAQLCGSALVTTNIGDCAAIARNTKRVIPPRNQDDSDNIGWAGRAKSALLDAFEDIQEPIRITKRKETRRNAGTIFSIEAFRSECEKIFQGSAINTCLKDNGIHPKGFPRLMPGTRTNKVFKIDTDRGMLYIKLYQQHGRDVKGDMQRMHAIVPSISNAPEFIGLTHSIGGYDADITKEAPGILLDPSSISLEQIHQLGRLVAKFHVETCSVRLKGSSTLPRDGQPKNEKDLREWDELPKGIVHLDFKPDNIRYLNSSPEKSTILDLEAVREGTLLADICRAVYELCIVRDNGEYTLDYQRVVSFMEGYHFIRPLESRELEFFLKALDNMANDRMGSWLTQGESEVLKNERFKKSMAIKNLPSFSKLVLSKRLQKNLQIPSRHVHVRYK